MFCSYLALGVTLQLLSLLSLAGRLKRTRKRRSREGKGKRRRRRRGRWRTEGGCSDRDTWREEKEGRIKWEMERMQSEGDVSLCNTQRVQKIHIQVSSDCHHDVRA